MSTLDQRQYPNVENRPLTQQPTFVLYFN